jgi:hypothetical protein
MNDQLAALEQRIAALEAQLAALMASISRPSSPTRLVAPMEVVDAEGKLLLTIQNERNDTSIRLYNAAGHAVTILGVDGSQAGYVTVRNADGHTVGYIDVETWGARLILQNHEGQGGVVVFGGDSGEVNGGGIHILNHTGELGISLWSTADGGELVLYDEHEQERVTIPPPSSGS